ANRERAVQFTAPPARRTTPAIAASRVLLPAPFAPTTEVRLPEMNSPLTASKAIRRPYRTVTSRNAMPPSTPFIRRSETTPLPIRSAHSNRLKAVQSRVAQSRQLRHPSAKLSVVTDAQNRREERHENRRISRVPRDLGPVVVRTNGASPGRGGLQSARRALAVWAGGSDRRHQSRHAGCHEGRRRRDPDRGGNSDGLPARRWRAAVRVLTSFATMPGAEFGKNKLSYMEDTYLSQSHVGTHIDGMGHIGIQDCYYNQTPMGKYITQNNLKRLGIENIKTFATRGVIIDAVKVFQAAGKLKANAACKRPCLDGGTMIAEADLQAGLKMYNVTLKEGDAVFINTGWGDLFEQFPAQNAAYNGGEPGITDSAAKWLASQKVVVVGSDTWAVEVIPGEDKDIAFPVHKTLITDNGIHIIENVRT